MKMPAQLFLGSAIEGNDVTEGRFVRLAKGWMLMPSSNQ